MGTNHAPRQRLASSTAYPASLAAGTLRRHTPKVVAVCGSPACTDLCGGRSEMSVPTANLAGHWPKRAEAKRIQPQIRFAGRGVHRRGRTGVRLPKSAPERRLARLQRSDHVPSHAALKRDNDGFESQRPLPRSIPGRASQIWKSDHTCSSQPKQPVYFKTSPAGRIARGVL